MKPRNMMFLVFLAGASFVYWIPVRNLFLFAWESDTYSYILLVPLVSAYFLHDNRHEIFPDSDRWHFPGVVPILLAAVLYILGSSHELRLSQTDHLALMTLSFLALLIGGLGFFFGVGAWKAAAFPIILLMFIVPIPAILLDKIVGFLQSWSADATYLIFRITGVPVFRKGYDFQLPGITIQVAKECSGIRSSISLLIVSLLAGHLMLRERWRRSVLTISIVPIAILKNAVRIVTLSLVAVYVDPGILGSVAHQRGGIPIFLLALVLLGFVLWILRRGDRKGCEI